MTNNHSRGKNRARRLCLSLAAVAMAACLLCVPAMAQEEASFQEIYRLGETVAIPQLTVEGIETAATVRQPDGSVCRAEGSFVPTQGGRYVVTYTGMDAQGNPKTREYAFTVLAPLYSVTGERSAATIGRFAYNGAAVGPEALRLSLASTDKFAYSQIIDLSKLGNTPFLEFFVAPETIGVNDATKIIVKLTDLHDPSNAVTIEIKRGVGAASAAWLQRNSYITANATGQAPTGLERNKGDMIIDGTPYLLHKNNVWGANVIFALSGNPAFVSLEQPNNLPGLIGSQKLALSLDLGSKRVYGNGQLIAMLASQDIYGKDVWEGFTTGECLLTIEGANFNASSLNLGITSLGGQITTGQLFRDNTLVDTTPPVITVDTPAGGLPNGVAGIPYRIPQASVWDDYTDSAALGTAVYFGTEKQVRVDVTDGTFTPFAPGQYTVVYWAQDQFGNVGTKEVVITADDFGAEMLQADIPQPERGTVGSMYALAVPSFTGNRGSISWQAQAVHESGVTYDISSDAPHFFPEYAGSYELRYTFRDYVTESTLTHTLTVEGSHKPVFMEDPVLPRYFLSGCLYTLPGIDARIYSSGGPAAAVPQIYLVEDGGAERAADYSFVTFAQQTLVVIYRLENNGEVTEYRSQPIPVVDVGYNRQYEIVKYFDCQGMTADPQGRYIRFAPESTAVGKATFINPLQTFNFSVRMSAVGKGFDTISLYLTDYTDPSVQLKFTYQSVNGAVWFSVNDGAPRQLADVVFNNSDMPLTLNLESNGTKVLPTGGSSVVFEVTHDLQGREFAGFAKSFAYLTVEMSGITNLKQSKLDIFSISNQIISGIYMDNIKPALSAVSAAGGRPAGTEFTIPAVFFADVLDPAASCVASVTAPDGSWAVSKDGTVLDTSMRTDLDHTLVLAEIGDYTVNYVVTDIAGNETRYSFVLKAADVIPPQVTFLGPVTQGKVNEKIALSAVQITDNYDTDPAGYTMHITVITPQGQSFPMLDKEGKQAGSFTPTAAGVYTVQYMVMDTSGNLTLASYRVTVQ